MNLRESVGGGCLAIIWTEEKEECTKRDEVCGERIISREQELEGEDEYW